MPREAIWELEPHTRAKHEILKRYLAAWFPILTTSGWNRRVIFLDGFAGPGRYTGGERGSPIIALDTLVNHKFFPKLATTEFLMIFVEEGDLRYQSLEAEVAEFWTTCDGGQPDNVKVELVHGTFADTADSILDHLDSIDKRLAPTFAFIDPFGFKGVPMATIARLLAYPKCEVFFNFMFDSLNRWVTHPDDSIHIHLEDLFGGNGYRAADGLPPAKRKSFLHDLYATQLKQQANCTHVHRFEMINQSGHTVYSLFFGTRSITGLRVMKDAMWSIDSSAGVRFSDRLANKEVLFQPDPDFAPLRAGILDTFAGKTVSVDEIEHYVLVATPYKASHYKKQVLKPLQDAGIVSPVSQRRAGTYPSGTMLRFSPAVP